MPIVSRGTHPARVTKNLPNYYIILRVQPNASQEAIKASFRKLMVTMKMHPDLGGDHDIAAQINEAYAVLSDGAKRSNYDRMYLLQRLRAAQTAARQKDHRAASNAGARPSAGSAWRPDPSSNSANGKTGLCPFCNTALPRSIRPETRCARRLSRARSAGSYSAGAQPRVPSRATSRPFTQQDRRKALRLRCGIYH